MTTYGMPGVYTTENLIGPESPAPANSPSVAGFIGEWWRGPVGFENLVQCNTWTDFATYFGGFNPNTTPVLANPYLGFAVYEFFANGGNSCYVSRIVSSTSPGTSASINLKDSAATPQNTLSLTVGNLGVAGNPGTWGNNLYVSVTNRGGAGSGRFDLTIYYGGTSLQNVVEQWIDLSMSNTDPRYVVAIINSAVQGSRWVVATDLGITNGSGGVGPIIGCPASITAGSTGTQFTGGVDPGDPAVADWQNAVTYNNGTAAMDNAPGMLNLALPGVSGTQTLSVATSIMTTAIQYAQNRPQTFLVIETPNGDTPAAAVAFAQSLTPPASDFCAVYYPWLNQVDPSSTYISSTKLLPPAGSVLGQYAANDASRGVWSAPAGLQTQLANVVSAERQLANTDLDTLNENNVNALRTMPNGTVVIWGTRTQQTGYGTMYVPVRRFLNYLETQFDALMLPYVFQPNDQVLWGTVSNTLTQFLTGLYSNGAFPGTSTSQAFYVVCNSSNNTPQSISQGILNVQVGVALLYPAEFIVINIQQFENTGTTNVTTATTTA